MARKNHRTTPATPPSDVADRATPAEMATIRDARLALELADARRQAAAAGHDAALMRVYIQHRMGPDDQLQPDGTIVRAPAVTAEPIAEPAGTQPEAN